MTKKKLNDTLQLADEILEYYYKNPSEESLPSPSHKSHYLKFTEDGSLSVSNVSAFDIPEFEVSEKIKGVTYIVDGTYEGEELLSQKLKRILIHNIKEQTEGSGNE